MERGRQGIKNAHDAGITKAAISLPSSLYLSEAQTYALACLSRDQPDALPTHASSDKRNPYLPAQPRPRLPRCHRPL